MKVQSTESKVASKQKLIDSPNKASSSPSSRKTKTYPSWHNVIAGAAAGAGARFFTAPLDLIKIRRQLVKPSSEGVLPTSFSPLGLFHSMRDVVRNEGGFTSLFRGNLAATVSTMQRMSVVRHQI